MADNNLVLQGLGREREDVPEISERGCEQEREEGNERHTLHRIFEKSTKAAKSSAETPHKLLHEAS